MMESLITSLARKLYDLNPSLLHVPPANTDQEDVICYNGPHGETSREAVILCQDLPAALRCNVASWFLSPEQHVQESLIVLVVFGTLLYLVGPKLQRHLADEGGRSYIQHPAYVRPLLALCFVVQLNYERLGRPEKLYFLLFPCNVIWLLVMTLCFGPNTWRPVALELICTYFILALVAMMVTPDTTDCMILPGEAIFYFVSHSVLLLVPILYLRNRSTTMRIPLSAHLWWWLASCAAFAIFYFVIVTIVSVGSGINLNYMMHPPPNQAILEGKRYRWMSIALCAIGFASSRVILRLLEVVLVPHKRIPARRRRSSLASGKRKSI